MNRAAAKDIPENAFDPSCRISRMIAWAWHRNEPYPQRLFRQLRSAPRDPALDERHARFVGLNVFVTERNAWITSVPGDTEVRMECLVDSTLPDEAAKLG
jgi:hypothetical protein